jgi:hypothetical protein
MTDNDDRRPTFLLRLRPEPHVGPRPQSARFAQDRAEAVSLALHRLR